MRKEHFLINKNIVLITTYVDNYPPGRRGLCISALSRDKALQIHYGFEELKNREPLLMRTAIHFDILALRDGIITHANSKSYLLYLCGVIHHVL